MYNLVTAVGNLASDITTRTTSTGKTIASFRVCISGRDTKDKCFIECEAWEKLGETCNQYLKKGSKIFLTGELRTSSWEKDGQKQSKPYLNLNVVKFMDSKPDGGDSADSEPQAKSKQNTRPAQQFDDEDEIPF